MANLITFVGSDEAALLARLRMAYAFLAPLSSDYPGFDHWFWTKVVPGTKTGSRCILMLERDGAVVALGIGKRHETERKICTVRVAPEMVNRGMGPRMFDHLLRWLETDLPHLTVGDRKLGQFERIFDRYGFTCTASIDGRYARGRVEHSFNGEENTQVDEINLSIARSRMFTPSAMTATMGTPSLVE